jgi:hypothetical protein
MKIGSLDHPQMKTTFTPIAKSLLVLVAAATLLLGGSCATKQTVETKHGQDTVYLFTSFHDSDQKFLRFLWSEDGYHWTNVPGTFLEANVGEAKQLRDPSIAQGKDGTFHLVWTTGWHDSRGFGYASSKDLVHWSQQKFIPVMAHEPTTVNVWAPEIFFDELDQQFIITWASTIPGRFPDLFESHTNNHRLYFTTTRDFESFTPTQLFLNPGFSVIDAFIARDADHYILICKDNSRPVLRIRGAFSKTPLGPWEPMSRGITQRYTEGPCVLKIGEDWLIYFDEYRDQHYGALKTRDFKNFTDVTAQMSFPEGHKHGTAIEVPRAIVDNLLKSQPANSKKKL